MDPQKVLEGLRERYVNTEIDWELMIEFGYREILDHNSVVVDVGGHAGRHADVFAREIECARLIVVEPLPPYAERLRQKYADLERVEVVEFALGLSTGHADFFFNEGIPEESGLRERFFSDSSKGALRPLTVSVRRLDDLCVGLSRLDFIKVDTEGGEIDILRGGQDALARFRPVLSVEYGAAGYLAYGKERATLFELAESLGYFLYDPFGNRFSTREDWDRCVDVFYWDFFMVPAERDEEIRARLAGQLGKLGMALKLPK